ncbi:hypothetical protein [uncultured Pontibacter sp.]|uniref:hypothetical protein n=1 Tax=uncultured Pontibacter sp. TaxID=453356 RepID=UPI0026385DB0|nr:hypothetical protein [uncultured Pontibacter sp.]
MQKVLPFLVLLFISIFSFASPNEQAEYEKLSRTIGMYLLKGTVKEFTKEFVPTKKDVLELAYQKKAKEVPVAERLGFYNTITPTTDHLEQNHFLAFNFLQYKLKKEGISELESIEVNSIQDEAFGKANVKNIVFTINGNGKSFKIEVTGAYMTSRGWIVMGDIAPSYF